MTDITEKKVKSLSNNKWVLITGASSGLGKDLSYLFAKEKYNLVLIARSEDKLNEIALDLREKYNSEVEIIIQDLSEIGAPAKIFDWCQSASIQIDILVNNAGFAFWGNFYEQGDEAIAEMLNLMVVNTTLLTSIFGREMHKNSRGKIVQISSTAAFQAGPFMSTYFASKSYLLLLSEAIQIESKFPKIQIVCPGAFHSNFEDRSEMKDVLFFKRAGVPDSKQIADKIFSFIHSDREIYIPGFMNKMIVFLLRFSPRKLAHKIIAGFLSKK